MTEFVFVPQPLSRKLNHHQFICNENDRNEKIQDYETIKVGDWLLHYTYGEISDYMHVYRVIEKTAKKITISVPRHTSLGPIYDRKQLTFTTYTSTLDGKVRAVLKNKSARLEISDFIKADEFYTKIKPLGGWCD